MDTNKINSNHIYNGQVEQDKFILNVLGQKENGFFVEIGSNDPIQINNTYLLEKNYKWRGIMIEYERKYLDSYKTHRPDSIHVINDATAIDYKELFETNNVPVNIDYLQIDLEANNGSTIRALEKVASQIMDHPEKHYKFATITFEHDIYHTNYMNTRERSREILRDHGYYCVFEDINNRGVNPFEDWWVHPDLVNMDYIWELQAKNQENYKPDSKTGKSLNWQDIQYPTR